MAKKDKAKSKPAKTPKSIAGVKLPKEFRMTGDALAGLITSPMVRELAADVLIAVAGAITANRRPKDAAANLAGNVADAGKGAASGAQTATEAVAGVVVEAARRILPSAVTGEGEATTAKNAGGDVRPATRTTAAKGRRRPSAETRREH